RVEIADAAATEAALMHAIDELAQGGIGRFAAALGGGEQQVPAWSDRQALVQRDCRLGQRDDMVLLKLHALLGDRPALELQVDLAVPGATDFLTAVRMPLLTHGSRR